MHLYCLIFVTLSTNFMQIVGSRVRMLDQMEYGEFEFNSRNTVLEAEKYSANAGVIRSTASCDSDYKHQVNIQAYVKRFVNTFMRHTDFKNVDTSNMVADEFVYGKLNIRLRAGHLEELKRFYYEEKPVSLSDLDLYLSGMFYSSSFEEFEGYLSKSMRITLAIFRFFYEMINILIFEYILTCLIFLYAWHKRGLKSALPILFVALFAVEVTQSYFVALKKAEIEQFRRLKKLEYSNPSCDPSTFSVFRLLRNLIYEDECQQLLEEMEISHISKVSLYQCFVEKFFHLFFEIPVGSIGKSAATVVSSLSVNSSVAWLLTPLLLVVIFGLLLAAVLILLGAKFNFSNWLIGRFSVGFQNASFFSSLPSGQAKNETETRDSTKDRPIILPKIDVNLTLQLPPTPGTTVAQGIGSITYPQYTPLVQSEMGYKNGENPKKCDCNHEKEDFNQHAVEQDSTKTDNGSQLEISHEKEGSKALKPEVEELNGKPNSDVAFLNDIPDGQINKLTVNEPNVINTHSSNFVEIKKSERGEDLKYVEKQKSKSITNEALRPKEVKDTLMDYSNLSKNENAYSIDDISGELSNLELKSNASEDSNKTFVEIEKSGRGEDLKYAEKQKSNSITNEELRPKEVKDTLMDYSNLTKNENAYSIDDMSGELSNLELKSNAREDSNKTSEHSDVSCDNVGSTINVDEEEKSFTDILETVEGIANSSSDSSELDFGAEVTSIKAGLRSLIEEDDFVNIQ